MDLLDTHFLDEFFFVFYLLHIILRFAVTEKSKSQTKKPAEKAKEENCSLFQRQRVDMLLGELLHKFPMPTNFDHQALHPPPEPQQSILDDHTDQDSDQQDELDEQRLLQSQQKDQPSPAPQRSPMNSLQSNQNGASTSAGVGISSQATKLKIKQEIGVTPSTSQQASMHNLSGNRRNNLSNMALSPPNDIKIKTELMGPPPDKKSKH